MGEVTIVANDQGVIRRPVVISEKPNLFRNKNGSEIIAMFCAINEHTEVAILKAYSLILNKSTGNIGDSRLS